MRVNCILRIKITGGEQQGVEATVNEYATGVNEPEANNSAYSAAYQKAVDQYGCDIEVVDIQYGE